MSERSTTSLPWLETDRSGEAVAAWPCSVSSFDNEGALLTLKEHVCLNFGGGGGGGAGLSGVGDDVLSNLFMLFIERSGRGCELQE